MKNFIIIVLLAIIAGLTWLLLAPDDYYEVDATSASECLPGELFDEEAKVCYFDFYCETDQECSEIDARYGDVLGALAEEYKSGAVGSVAYGNIPTNATPTEDALPDFARPLASSTPRTIQELIKALLPASEAKRIVSFEKNSDGEDGILAYVEPASADGSTWKLGYDPVDSFNDDGSFKNPKQLMATLIHEYMHIVSLNDTQVDHAPIDAEYVECDLGQTILNEGCARKNAYISKFIAKFWDENTREAAFQAMVDGEDEDFSYENYDKNPSHFVTEYAATNAVEDIAESFTIFVMQDRTASPKTIAEQKTDFFYQFSKLVSLRKHMRGGLAKVLEPK